MEEKKDIMSTIEVDLSTPTFLSSYQGNVAPQSFFFVEVFTGDHDRFGIGYTRNIYAWSKNKHVEGESKYILILKTDSETGGKEIWTQVRDTCKKIDLETFEPPSGTFPYVQVDFKTLTKIVQDAVRNVASGSSLKVEVFRLAPKLMF